MPNPTNDFTNGATCCPPAAPQQSCPPATECYPAPPKICLNLSNWGAACGCCGETYVIADVAGFNPTHAVDVTITDKSVTDMKYQLDLTLGCVKRSISICAKGPAKVNFPAATDWASFIYSALATDPILLQHNVQPEIIGAPTGGPTYKMTIRLSSPKCDVSAVLGNEGGDLSAVVAPVAQGSVPQLGQFVSYAYNGNKLSGISTYDGSAYMGLLMLPDNIPATACCVPSSCSCNAVGSCRKIMRTGRARVRLTAPMPAPVAGQDYKLATAPDGGVQAYSGAAAPAGYTAFPYPVSFILTPESVGSTLVTVVLH
jgi:hypothetical protein